MELVHGETWRSARRAGRLLEKVIDIGRTRGGLATAHAHGVCTATQARECARR